MAKFLFFTALLAALAAISVAQGEGAQGFRDMQCRREVQQSPLDACRQVVDRQLSSGSGLRVMMPPWMKPAGPRTRCCQQLQDLSLECRCAAIRRMVRNYEQSLAPLEGGYPGETEQQQEGYYGKAAEQQQGQREGYYGERQQQGGYYGGEQEGGCGYYGGEHQQQEGGFYGGDQEGGYYGGERQQVAGEEYEQVQGQGFSGDRQKQRRGYIGFPPLAGTQQQTTRERLTKVRQYAQQLPAMCRIEPQDCTVFAAGQY